MLLELKRKIKKRAIELRKSRKTKITTEEERINKIKKYKKIPKKLMPLVKEALKYKTFKKFHYDYTYNLMRGRYWHITDKKNFTLDITYRPRDLSSLAHPALVTPIGLMISYTPELWHLYFPDRKYAVEVDISALKPNKDYNIVNRGYGHEIFVKNLNKVKISKTMPISKAIKDSEHYNNIIPQTKNELKVFWDKVHELYKEKS